MIYLPELYYLYNTKFPFKKAVKVTAKSVGKYCSGYKARLISNDKSVKETLKEGKLPKSPKEKEIFIEKLVDWIFKNSWVKDLFALFLYKDYPPNKKGIAKFDHHDDTCCWSLYLEKKEFSELKKSWKKNNLPEDIFYPESKQICISQKDGIVWKSLKKIGFTGGSYKCYTPKQWGNREK